MTLATLGESGIKANLEHYIQSFSKDAREIFEYFNFAEPPFGVDWKKIEEDINNEHTHQGFEGRFGSGLPRVSDGSLLFLLHLISKLRDASNGSTRIGIILNGSPLFTGGAGSGESEKCVHRLAFEIGH